MRRFLAALLLCFAGVVPSAQAALVTLRATGTVTSVDNSSSLLPVGISGSTIGNAFTIEYSFDSATADVNPSSSVGAYNFGSAFSLTATIGGNSYVLVTNNGVIGVQDDFLSSGTYYDRYQVSASQFSGAGEFLSSALIGLFNAGSTAPQPGLDSQLLPVIGFDPTIFANRSMELRFRQIVSGVLVGEDLIIGTVTSIENVSAVPLPAAAWLMLSGLGGLGFLGRRRKAA